MKLPPPDSFAQYNERVLNICALHDCSTTSGARTWKRYSAICAKLNPPRDPAPTSKHLLEMGAWADDLVANDMSEDSRADIVADCKTLGLYVEDETDHIHVQGKPPGGL